MGFVPNERGLSLVMILIILVVLVGAGAGGFFAYTRILKKNPGPSMAALPHVEMSEDVVGFTFRKLPTLYDKLVRLNREISLIDMELARIDSLESEFPKQKKIIKPERTIWDKTRKNLLATVKNFEKKIETVYVAYMVNEEKGKGMIEGSVKELEASADEVLTASRAETSRIPIPPPAGFLEKLKAKFGK